MKKLGSVLAVLWVCCFSFILFACSGGGSSSAPKITEKAIIQACKEGAKNVAESMLLDYKRSEFQEIQYKKFPPKERVKDGIKEIIIPIDVFATGFMWTGFAGSKWGVRYTLDMGFTVLCHEDIKGEVVCDDIIKALKDPKGDKLKKEPKISKVVFKEL